jgi:hypothetical protein
MSVVSTSFNGGDSANLPDVFEPCLNEPLALENSPVCQMSDTGNSYGVLVGGKQVPGSCVVEEQTAVVGDEFYSAKNRFLDSAYAYAWADGLTGVVSDAGGGGRGPTTLRLEPLPPGQLDGWRQPRPQPAGLGDLPGIFGTAALAGLGCAQLGPWVAPVCAAVVVDYGHKEIIGAGTSHLGQAVDWAFPGKGQAITSLQETAVTVLEGLGALRLGSIGTAVFSSIKDLGRGVGSSERGMATAGGQVTALGATGTAAGAFALYRWFTEDSPTSLSTSPPKTVTVRK